MNYFQPRIFNLLSLLSLCLLLGVWGCGREREEGVVEVLPDEPPSIEATATSLAVVAATPTLAEQAPAEPTSTVSIEPTAAEEPNPEPTSANEDSVESATASTSAELSCQHEIALDLIGHPDYALLPQQLGCPQAGASTESVAINEFGPGPEYDRFMLWFSTDTQIYLLKPDLTWQAHADTWQEGDPEIQCNPLGGEETSPPLPRRGFGKLWCSDTEIQESMGAITREERLCQHTVLQPFEKGQLLGCFEDATIRYFKIFSDGSWDMIFVQ